MLHLKTLETVNMKGGFSRGVEKDQASGTGAGLWLKVQLSMDSGTKRLVFFLLNFMLHTFFLQWPFCFYIKLQHFYLKNSLTNYMGMMLYGTKGSYINYAVQFFIVFVPLSPSNNT